MATILIVDDEQPVRELLAELVQEAGHVALLATNGQEALEIIAAERPSLAIVDVMMPILGGVELSRRLKADKRWRTIPVVLMSSADRRVSDGAGADAFLAKPFDLPTVEQLLERWTADR